MAARVRPSTQPAVAPDSTRAISHRSAPRRRDADRVESANDLALDGEGRLLLISSHSRRIARLATPLDPASHDAGVDDGWKLPDLPGRTPRPEALCVEHDAVLVGLDSRDPGDNLVALEPIA